MDLLFHPDPETTLRLRSPSGSWFATVSTFTEVTCGHGLKHTVMVEYEREFTSKDEGPLLDSFETALRALAADTEEQKVEIAEHVRRLTASLIDECVYVTFTDPCLATGR